ncbi:MAG: hypothetical protein JWO53_1088 [Chlamydiia bacterium]|nr:hypothetical protein [Chlamydiia bacterium]
MHISGNSQASDREWFRPVPADLPKKPVQTKPSLSEQRQIPVKVILGLAKESKIMETLPPKSFIKTILNHLKTTKNEGG